ncbi:LpqB family beta-propeller domain-containing protein [Spirillospora sp. NBC_01491]|uniref:LpqB family beta-propeller domain-containing protein n=1 Tax=Spirillospora sp. NBC_01491 TaxID=2976007 RepID=UPI002E33ABA7|nr:LpqB family beta-propeller domain-containing protein [Spirillospora sp. NBC_01491]
MTAGTPDHTPGPPCRAPAPRPGGPSGPRRIPPALLVFAVLTLCVAGCANVPGGGRVVSGKPVERAEQVDDPYVRLIPVRPRPEWGPEEIVSGFLAASASFDDDHKVAREFLAAQTSWRPGLRPSVTVMRNREAPRVVKQTATQAVVKVVGDQLGTIASDGQYRAAAEHIEVSFQLGRTPQGLWRVTGLPDDERAGLLLTQVDVERALRPVNLYFFAPDQRTLVPNGIFLPVVNRRDLPSQLVRALLNGPTSWLYGAVKSAFPPGTHLSGEGVEISKDIATVDLSKEAGTGSVERMSAQLSWTLRQFSEIKRWRLRIGGEAVAPKDMNVTQDVRAWEVNAPDGHEEQVTQSAYGIGGSGFLSTLDGRVPQPVTTGNAWRLSRPAVAPDYQEVAGLTSKGDQVLTAAPLTGSPTPKPLLASSRRGGRFTPPSWGRDGLLWTVETAKDKSWLWVRQRGRPPARVSHWGLSGREVMAFRVARDGVRAAVIVDVDGEPQVQIGRIVRDARGAVDVGSFLPVSSELLRARDLVWRDYGTLAVLGQKDSDTQALPYLMPVSGSAITSLGVGSLGEPRTITAAPGSPVLIGTRASNRNLVCKQRSPRDQFSEWACDIPATDPTYAR